MRDLDQQSRAVAALAIRVEAAAVGEASQRGDAQADRLVAELGRGDKSHAAGRPGCGKLPGPCKA